MSNITLKRVESAADRKAFVDLVWKLYANDPHWVPPLKSEMLGLIGGIKSNPWFGHAEAAFWLALKGGEVVGRISAQVDQLVIAPGAPGAGPGTGHFGTNTKETVLLLCAGLVTALPLLAGARELAARGETGAGGEGDNRGRGAGDQREDGQGGPAHHPGGAADVLDPDGVVVDDRVDVVVADLGLSTSVGRTHLSAVCAPAATVGDPSDLLDIHVDQLAGAFTFVADSGGLRGPDHLARQRVALAQPRNVMSSQDPADRPCRDTELGTQPVLPSAMFPATVQDLLLDLRAGACRRRVWSGASIVKPFLTFGSEPGDPPVRALAGHAHRFGDVRDRHPGLDTFDE